MVNTGNAETMSVMSGQNLAVHTEKILNSAVAVKIVLAGWDEVTVW